MSRTDFVLDASALLCLLYEEPGAERVEAILDRARISAVNHAEVVAKLVDRGQMAEEASADLRELGLDVVSFDRELVERSGALRRTSRKLGLSLGDRACLALASRDDAVAITTDRAWATLDIGIRVEIVR